MFAYQLDPGAEACPKTEEDCNAWAWIQQPLINNSPGASFTLTLYAKATSIATPGDPLGGCTLLAFVGATNDPADSSFVFVEDFSESTTIFQPLMQSWVILDTNSFLTLKWECSVGASGQVWLDRISLTPSS
jgi:hypothetical protein